MMHQDSDGIFSVEKNIRIYSNGKYSIYKETEFVTETCVYVCACVCVCGYFNIQNRPNSFLVTFPNKSKIVNYTCTYKLL